MRSRPFEQSLTPCDTDERAYVTLTLHEAYLQVAHYDAAERGYPSLERYLERLLSDGIERNAQLRLSTHPPRLKRVK